MLYLRSYCLHGSNGYSCNQSTTISTDTAGLACFGCVQRLPFNHADPVLPPHGYGQTRLVRPKFSRRVTASANSILSTRLVDGYAFDNTSHCSPHATTWRTAWFCRTRYRARWRVAHRDNSTTDRKLVPLPSLQPL